MKRRGRVVTVSGFHAAGTQNVAEVAAMDPRLSFLLRTEKLLPFSITHGRICAVALGAA